ncbi:PcfJ domain-containing protein [Anaerobacillus sp. HL2]|nr:PcfJ domain-containing protein [Anaerobacillus sp. HL2]
MVFEKNGYLWKLAKSSIEMFDEGKALDHCVGRYAESYAKGPIAIMFIRKTDEPDKSFYTLEVDMGSMSVTQCRGLKNCGTTEDVKQFVEAFKKEKLSKKRRKTKIAQTA